MDLKAYAAIAAAALTISAFIGTWSVWSPTVFGWGALAGDFYEQSVGQRFDEKLALEDRLVVCEEQKNCTPERVQDLKHRLHEKGLQYDDAKQNFEKYEK